MYVVLNLFSTWNCKKFQIYPKPKKFFEIVCLQNNLLLFIIPQNWPVYWFYMSLNLTFIHGNWSVIWSCRPENKGHRVVKQGMILKLSPSCVPEISLIQTISYLNYYLYEYCIKSTSMSIFIWWLFMCGLPFQKQLNYIYLHIYVIFNSTVLSSIHLFFFFSFCFFRILLFECWEEVHLSFCYCHRWWVCRHCCCSCTKKCIIPGNFFSQRFQWTIFNI